jgi:hypothetical protein
VAIYPKWLWPLAHWNLEGPYQSAPPQALHGQPVYAYVKGGAPFDGRVWLMQPNSYAFVPPKSRSCGTVDLHAGDYTVSCYQLST